MAKKKQGSVGAEGVLGGEPEGGSPVKVRARVLAHCSFGAPNDIAEVDEQQLPNLVGVVDADPDAVAYVESLTGA